MGCNGGQVGTPWKWFKNKGVVTGGDFGTSNTCFNYTMEQCAHHVTSATLPSCDDVKKLIFARVVLLCQLLDLLVCFLVLTPECLVNLSESFNLGCLLAHICIFGVALIKIVS